MNKYVILKTESQKDGTNYSVMTERKANEIIKINHEWRDEFEIISDVTQSIKFVLSDISNQRELLISFLEYLRIRGIANTKEDNVEVRVDLFIKRNL